MRGAMAVREIGRNDQWRDATSVPSPNAERSLVLVLRQPPHADCRAVLGWLPLSMAATCLSSCPSSNRLNGDWNPKRHETVWRAVASRKGGWNNRRHDLAAVPESLRAQLASTTSAPTQGGFAPAPAAPAPVPAPSPAPAQSGSLFPSQQPATPPAGGAASTGGGSASAQQAQFVVPDQQSFGSMSIRTSTYSPARGITATRSKVRTCARQTPKLPVIARRRTSAIHKVNAVGVFDVAARSGIDVIHSAHAPLG